jgi:hypothetical protein
MKPQEFLKTLYLGDRVCKRLIFDGWDDRVLIQVNVISRIRSDSGLWDFYSQEDIPDGLIVFSGVKSYQWNSKGCLPNDYVEIEVSSETETLESDLYQFNIYLGRMEKTGIVDTELLVEAQAIHLEDPRSPNKKITN